MERSKVLLRAIEAAGGTAAALGRRIGVTRQAIEQWDQVPINRVFAVEKATDGKVTRYEMRPDIFGPPPLRVTQ